MQEFHEFLKVATPNCDLGNIQITKLFGQASARQYYRVTQPEGSAKIIMKIPGGFASPAEEFTKIHPDAPKEFPFLNVLKYLHSLDLPVPEVFHYDADKGLVLLQDLGDESFENLIIKAEGGPLVSFYYQKAIDLLISMQTQTAQNPAKDCVAFFRKFDADLLNWEFDHFLEYGIEDRLKLQVAAADKQSFLEHTRHLTENIAAMPQGFVHRDFQSRNLMFHEMDLYLIDFQDALIGPVLYDLVALLRDSYVNLSPTEVDSLIDYYSAKLPASHPYANNKSQIRTDFYTITLQRKLKDAGRFQYIDTVRKNPNFLVHIPWTLQFLKHAFLQVPNATVLHGTLQKYVPEFK